MYALNKIKFVVDKFTEVICTIILGVMTVLVTYQVFARYVMHNPSSITEALSQYLFVWMIMFGSAYVYGSREHLTIDLLRDKFSPRGEMITEIACNICLSVFVILVCIIGGWMYTQGQVNQIDPSLMISKSVLYFSVPFTGVITVFYALYNSVLAVHNFKAGIQETDDGMGNSLV